MKHKVLFQTIKKTSALNPIYKKDIYDQCNIRKTIKLNVYLFYVAGFFFLAFLYGTVCLYSVGILCCIFASAFCI